jgi:predicted nuclease of predicted toxin-antitoxin system
VKVLIDIQLPSRLTRWFEERNHEAIHASELPNGLTLADAEIWQFAKDRGLVIASKDVDFYDMSLLYGKPPVVLLIRYGNCSNKNLFQNLENTWHQVQQALDNQEVRMVVLHPERIEIYG